MRRHLLALSVATIVAVVSGDIWTSYDYATLIPRAHAMAAGAIDARVHLVERHARFLEQLVAHVFPHRERVEQRRALEQHPEPPPQGIQFSFIYMTDLGAVDGDRAPVGLGQADYVA